MRPVPLQVLRILFPQTRVDQLLLGVIYDIPVEICQEAVSSLPDPHLVNIICNVGKTDIEGEMADLSPAVLDVFINSDDPWILIYKD